jgi:hypothetical protein
VSTIEVTVKDRCSGVILSTKQLIPLVNDAFGCKSASDLYPWDPSRVGVKASRLSVCSSLSISEVLSCSSSTG